MNSNPFNTGEEEDPWSNWNASTDRQQANSTSPILPSSLTPGVGAPPGAASYLTSSQLLSRASHTDTTTNSSIITNVPESYKDIHTHLIDKLKTINDLEIHIFNKLITMNYLTNYQKSRILDLAYDNNLMPILIATNFYMVLGLIALEIDVPGSADYVSLQFRLNSLPDLPKKFVSSIIDEDEQGDEDATGYHPLLANRTEEDDYWKRKDDGEERHDPILKDHSTSRLIEPLDSGSDVKGGAGTAATGGVGAGGLVLAENVVSEDTVDTLFIEKYVDEIRDRFKPLIEDNADAVKIKEVPEKEGILFKHINYIISHNLQLGRGTSSHGQKKAVRRYSDFVWYV